MASSRISAFFISSLLLLAFNQIVAEATQVETRIVKTSLNEGVIDLSVRLSFPFDWKDERYFSKKEFPVEQY